jgi:hypothetical protein
VSEQQRQNATQSECGDRDWYCANIYPVYELAISIITDVDWHIHTDFGLFVY